MTSALPVKIPPLPPELTSRGGSVKTIADELLWVIGDAIANHPRSLQVAIGPSELGHTCARRIGYKMLGSDEVNHRNDPPWKPTVGTAVHSLLETYFDRFNLMFADSTGGQERFLLEHRVIVGQVGGKDITGSADLYDRCTAAVVDWKCCGPSMLRHYKANGPGDQYRTQAHLYGRGFALLGHPVDQVMIMFLPRDGELRDAYAWSEPYDEQVALAGLARANAIHATTMIGGRAALPLLPTADAYCTRCEYFLAGSTDPTIGCPGDMTAHPVQQPALTLTAPTPT